MREVRKDLEDEKLVHSLKGVFSLKEDVASSILKTKDQVTRILSALTAEQKEPAVSRRKKA